MVVMVFDVDTDTTRTEREKALFIAAEIGQFLRRVVDTEADRAIHNFIICWG